MEDSLTVSEPLAEALDQAQKWLRPLLKHAWVPESLCYEVELIVEEILVNILKHGLAGSANKDVEIRRRLEDNKLWLEFRDNGPAFDPLSVPDPDLTTDIENRSLGGVGIYLVKQLVDDLHYVRQDNINCLRIGKMLKASQTEPPTSINH